MKKNIISFILFVFYCFAFGQVAIGKTSISSPGVSLEFYDNSDNNKGIIIPWVVSIIAMSDAVNGTLIYNTSDKKNYIKLASGWRDLSVSSGSVDTTLQDSLVDINTAKVVIGGDPNVDVTPGILVLADTDKAMVLPKVASPHLNIQQPSAGMIVYDTTAHQLAVFNGVVWSFWKP